jgi:hypothetical protein
MKEECLELVKERFQRNGRVDVKEELLKKSWKSCG